MDVNNLNSIGGSSIQSENSSDGDAISILSELDNRASQTMNKLDGFEKYLGNDLPAVETDNSAGINFALHGSQVSTLI
ncbi:hypothetical protein A2625_07655 [candidate division WOR-1 bacterium RIFCSPHIGHO2_01_FULL_53_15]|uniref:Uncharacterized protein n=1 Tax=candidate division WOR-1 bacterium RIFCSPHIGHO2_01_FULL_53_15 TaxID=1802564 RepID=A0A1F4Q4K9_UNCSA|nr:MAG: hypothetical protein A2625_07655 [candidate division WOR-1 bacterium RIFCSPHIGHO2_01_FULL_53_15]OGC10551.1 MAG: hypothetical protein A3D23_01510 [candidate division WOR-1 bacterium RIFCSPHIGHO2_02_FULL_53_26]